MLVTLYRVVELTVNFLDELTFTKMFPMRFRHKASGYSTILCAIGTVLLSPQLDFADTKSTLLFDRHHIFHTHHLLSWWDVQCSEHWILNSLIHKTGPWGGLEDFYLFFLRLGHWGGVYYPISNLEKKTILFN